MLNKYTFLLLILSAVSIFLSCKSEISGNSTDNQVKIAPEFRLADLKGEESYTLSQFKGKPVILNFWATWCGPCREEMPFLQKSWEKYKNDGLVFIGINIMDDSSSAIDFLNDYNINYLNLMDKPGDVSGKYGVAALPATFFISKEGNIYKQNYGPFLGETGEELFIKYTEEILK